MKNVIFFPELSRCSLLILKKVSAAFVEPSTTNEHRTTTLYYNHLLCWIMIDWNQNLFHLFRRFSKLFSSACLLPILRLPPPGAYSMYYIALHRHIRHTAAADSSSLRPHPLHQSSTVPQDLSNMSDFDMCCIDRSVRSDILPEVLVSLDSSEVCISTREFRFESGSGTYSEMWIFLACCCL